MDGLICGRVGGWIDGWINRQTGGGKEATHHRSQYCCISFVCLIWFIMSHQQSFSYVGSDLPGLNQYWARINVLPQGHKAMTLVRLGTAAPQSRVKHSTTEPLHCLLLYQSVDITEGTFFRATAQLLLVSSQQTFSATVSVRLKHWESQTYTSKLMW